MRCRSESFREATARHAWIPALVLLWVLAVPAGSWAAASGALEEARRQFDAGQYQQAAGTLRGALEHSPQDAALHHWLARCYFELEDYGHAIASAERSVQFDPHNSQYHLWLGRAYGRKAEQAGWFSGFSLAKKSRHEFEEAVRLDRSNFAAHHDLIEFYVRAPGIVGGGDEKGWQQAEALAAVDAVEGHLGRAEYWKYRKKPERAEQEYRQVLAAKPKRVDPYLAVAEFYLSRGDAGRAEEALEAAARVNASDRRLSYYCGVVRVVAGNRLEEAEHCLKTYLTTVPPRSDLPAHADGHEWLGRLYERQGKCAAAVEQYGKAMELDPHSKSAREALRRAQRCASGR